MTQAFSHPSDYVVVDPQRGGLAGILDGVRGCVDQEVLLTVFDRLS
jgi:hypothetical protein